jgi:bile acid:Na+ symporter, BASS family
MFGGALRLKPETIRQAGKNPRLFLRTLFVIWIAVPIFSILVIWAVGITGRSAAILLLMSVCPGVPLLLGTTRNVQGAMATAFLALVLTAVTEPLMIPFWTRLLSSHLSIETAVKPKHILDVLLPVVFMPIAIGLVIRDLSEQATAILLRVSDLVYLVGVSACVVAIAIKGLPWITQVPPRAIFAAWVITIGDVLLGYWAGSPNTEDRKAIALATALGNPALAIAVVEESDPAIQAAVLVSVYLIVRGLIMMPVEWGLKRVKA